ncbi:MAG: hypothetical protein HYV55_00355 [Parcubacteria group bacterium]|nr:hypothetical protein [Parcubacteria group bacterium]
MTRALLYALLVLGGLGSLPTVLSTRFGTELWWWLTSYLVGGASLITVLMTEPEKLAKVSRVAPWIVPTISALTAVPTAGRDVLDAFQGRGGIGIDYYIAHIVDYDYALGIVFCVAVATISLIMLPAVCVAFLKMANQFLLGKEKRPA